MAAELAASALAKCFQPGTRSRPPSRPRCSRDIFVPGAAELRHAPAAIRVGAAREGPRGLRRLRPARRRIGRPRLELRRRRRLARQPRRGRRRQQGAGARTRRDRRAAALRRGWRVRRRALPAGAASGWASAEAMRGGRGATRSRRPRGGRRCSFAGPRTPCLLRCAPRHAGVGRGGRDGGAEGGPAGARRDAAGAGGGQGAGHVVLDHDARAAAVDGGALAALRAHAAVAVVEAALTLLCCAVVDGAADLAARCGAHDPRCRPTAPRRPRASSRARPAAARPPHARHPRGRRHRRAAVAAELSRRRAFGDDAAREGRSGLTPASRYSVTRRRSRRPPAADGGSNRRRGGSAASTRRPRPPPTRRRRPPLRRTTRRLPCPTSRSRRASKCCALSPRAS